MSPGVAFAPEERLSHDDVDGRDALGARGGPRSTRRRWRAILGLLVLVSAAAALVGSPWWGPRALSSLAFFRVRRVEIDGVRYASADELTRRLAVDTTWSVWSDLDVPARRLRAHPLVADAQVERRLPGTLRVVITEKRPVALVPDRDGLAVYDAGGARLPIAADRVGGVDVPIVPARDTALLRLLGALQADAPRLFARVSEARREARRDAGDAAGADAEIALLLTSSPVRLASGTAARDGRTMTVRAMASVTAARLVDILLVEDDLARRRARVAELDLRYRDQVIARLQ